MEDCRFLVTWDLQLFAADPECERQRDPVGNTLILIFHLDHIGHDDVRDPDLLHFLRFELDRGIVFISGQEPCVQSHPAFGTERNFLHAADGGELTAEHPDEFAVGNIFPVFIGNLIGGSIDKGQIAVIQVNHDLRGFQIPVNPGPEIPGARLRKKCFRVGDFRNPKCPVDVSFVRVGKDYSPAGIIFLVLHGAGRSDRTASVDIFGFTPHPFRLGVGFVGWFHDVQRQVAQIDGPFDLGHSGVHLN